MSLLIQLMIALEVNVQNSAQVGQEGVGNAGECGAVRMKFDGTKKKKG